MRDLLQGQRNQGLGSAKPSAGRRSRLIGKKASKARGIDAGLTPPQKARTLKPCVCESFMSGVRTSTAVGRQDLDSVQFVAGQMVLSR